MYLKQHRALAVLACAAFLTVALFSVLFLVSEAGHDCIGEGCPVCACIHQGERTLKQLGMGSACAVRWMPAAGLPILAAFSALRAVVPGTPVSQKVRANN